MHRINRLDPQRKGMLRLRPSGLIVTPSVLATGKACCKLTFRGAMRASKAGAGLRSRGAGPELAGALYTEEEVASSTVARTFSLMVSTSSPVLAGASLTSETSPCVKCSAANIRWQRLRASACNYDWLVAKSAFVIFLSASSVDKLAFRTRQPGVLVRYAGPRASWALSSWLPLTLLVTVLKDLESDLNPSPRPGGLSPRSPS